MAFIFAIESSIFLMNIITNTISNIIQLNNTAFTLKIFVKNVPKTTPTIKVNAVIP